MDPFPCSVRTNEIFLISSLSCPCRLLSTKYIVRLGVFGVAGMSLVCGLVCE